MYQVKRCIIATTRTARLTVHLTAFEPAWRYPLPPDVPGSCSYREIAWIVSHGMFLNRTFSRRGLHATVDVHDDSGSYTQ